MRRVQAWVLLGGLLAGLGCHSTARYVRKEPDGGVVAIPTNTNHWPNYHRDEADRLMRLVCPNGYTILEEKEVAIAEAGKTRREYHLTFRSKVQVPDYLQPGGASVQPRGTSPGPIVPSSVPPPGLPPRPLPISP